MRLGIRVALLCLVAISAATIHAQVPSTAGCTEKKGYYQCNETAFKKVLEEAKTVAIETEPSDKGATKALSDYTASLGKSQASEDADLTFLLVKTLGQGIIFGPADEELALLNVYSRGTGGQHGKLIWTEMYHGQPDMAWATVVHLTIQQFQIDIK